MAWFRREPTPPAPAPPAPDAGDGPEALKAAITTVNRMVNASAGRLPLRAVVAARRITDGSVMALAARARKRSPASPSTH